jgi:hypothetical protein
LHLSILQEEPSTYLLLHETALDFIEKKTGHTLGRDQNEKITDGARGLYEKATGYACFSFCLLLLPLS